ncbi:MAG TPA: thioesterase family protein [Sphingobium sp.]
MVRIDRARIEAAKSPVIEIVQTRFDDLDTQGHINNGAVVVLLQEARARFNRTLGLPRIASGVRVMVAGLQVEFARELHHPEPFEVATSILSVGRTSFVMGQVGRQHGQAAVYAETAIVMADANGPMPLPDDLRAAYLELCGPLA